jgi:hypothetical protein
MRIGIATCAAALIAGAGNLSAQAPDVIKAGKWEYTVTTQMPNMPKLPPGVQLPPNVQIQPGAGGMTIKNTRCVTSSDPTAELRKPQGPNAADRKCKLETMERNGSSIHWVNACTSPRGSLRMEGSVRYTGETMEGDFKSQVTTASRPPMERTSHITGRYLGPCDGK